MYEPIGKEFLDDAFLAKYLGEEKLKEKFELREKIKHKRQQIELTSKHVRSDRQAKARRLEKKKAGKNKLVLSCKMKKKLGMYKLDKNEKLEYEKYEAMNKLWRSYAYSCLLTCLPDNLDASRESQSSAGCLSEESVLNCLKQLDYHGCHLTVTRSNSKYQIGLSGFVLQDRKNVFFLLTKENKIKIVQKSGNLFELELFDCKFTLVGANMCYKPEIRTTKHAKIKSKTNIN
jgi:ribonuclease P protein subunit POP4